MRYTLEMSLKITNKNKFNPTKQHGISMAFLLFAMIIVSLLAAALMRLNSQSSISTVHQIISTRAFFAAESGANLQTLSIFPITRASACTNQTYNFNVDGLLGCSSVTSCTSFTINSKNYYQVTSKGQCNSGQDLQATRTIEIRLQDIN
jgi:MSHA biogenesis protein MshP